MATHKALLLLAKQGESVVRDTPTPKPGPGELLVEVKAAGLNPVDWKVNYDYSFLIQSYPAILGSDAAGVVKEIGEGVTGFAAGDRVCVFFFLSLGILYAKPAHSIIAFFMDRLQAELSSNTQSSPHILPRRCVFVLLSCFPSKFTDINDYSFHPLFLSSKLRLFLSLSLPQPSGCIVAK